MLSALTVLTVLYKSALTGLLLDWSSAHSGRFNLWEREAAGIRREIASTVLLNGQYEVKAQTLQGLCGKAGNSLVSSQDFSRLKFRGSVL